MFAASAAFGTRGWGEYNTKLPFAVRDKSCDQIYSVMFRIAKQILLLSLKVHSVCATDFHSSTLLCIKFVDENIEFVYFPFRHF